MILIKGKHSVYEALESGIPILRISISTSIKHHDGLQEILQQAKRRQIVVEKIPKDQFKRLVADKHSQHIVAHVASISHHRLEDVVAKTDPLIVVLDHLQDPHNVGAILRSCEALGVSTVIYPKDRQVAITAGVIKASSGAIYHIKLIKVTNLAQAIEHLKKKGYWIYGSTSQGGESLTKITTQFPSALVVGNEQKGLSKRIVNMLDLAVNIPMQGHVDSLNVSVATGIMIYEFNKSRLR